MSTTFDPNAAADPNAGIFGLAHSFEEASFIFIPVPWEATTSYGAGTAFGPDSILQASTQLDLFDLDVINPYEAGMHLIPIDEKISTLNIKAKSLAQPIKDAGGIAANPSLKGNLDQVNALSDQINNWVYEQTLLVLSKNKIPGILGGDHSVPFGAIQAAAKKYGEFGILHFDAHSDNRFQYMGFHHSHASIMRNVGDLIPEVKKIVQVGIRDFCEEEYKYIESQKGRYEVFYDQMITRSKLDGISFTSIAQKMISALPKNVWISFDIDGLDPRYCPHTGTPVPGGLDFAEAVQVISLLARSGRKIIGFDLVEVAPPLDTEGSAIPAVQASDEWDANVGMRLLYKMAAFALASQGMVEFRKV